MEKDSFKTNVIFRREKKTGDIIAIFPDEKLDNYGNLACYAHVGQHSVCCYDYYLNDTLPLKDFNEYKNLFIELENIGYNLKVVKKYNIIVK